MPDQSDPRTNLRDPLALLSGLLLALALGWSIACRDRFLLLPVPDHPLLPWIIPPILLLFWFPLASNALRRLAQHFPSYARYPWWLTSLLCGAILTFVIPITPPDFPTTAPRHTLFITATGQKNPAAQGTEVWLLRAVRHDGREIPPTDFAPDPGWTRREGAWLSHTTQPATLRWEGPLTAHLDLVFVSHPWSGQVTITWNQQPQTIDLYNTTSDNRIITLPAINPPPDNREALTLSVLTADAIQVGSLLFLLSLFLATARLGRPAPASLRRILLYAGVCILVWSVSLAAYWPGLLSSDSVDQWREMLKWELTDAHPALHTMLLWLITRPYESPAAVAIFQILVLALISGWGLGRLRRDGVPALVVWLTLAIYAMSPVNTRIVLTIWKDVLFSAAVLLLILLLREIVATRGEHLRRWSFGLALVLTATFVAVLRHNGLPTAVAALGVLIFFYPRHWWRIGLLLVSLALAILIVRGPLYAAAGVDNIFTLDKMQRTAVGAGSGKINFQLAAHVKAGTPLKPDERALLESVAPLNTWARVYDPFRRILFRRGRDFDFQRAREQVPQLAALLRDLNRRAPHVYRRHLYWRTSLVWRIRHHRNSFYSRVLGEEYNGRIVTIHRNPYGIEPNPISEDFQRTWYHWLRTLQSGPGFWLHWRPALQLWLFLAAVVIAALRTRNAAYLALAAPLIVNSYFIATLAAAQDFRYQYAVYLCGYLLGPGLLFIHARARRSAPPHPASQAS